MNNADSQNESSSEYRHQRRHGVFCLLSLDCVVPFWREMGLSVNAEHQELVRDAARAAYLTMQGGEQSYYAARYDAASVRSAIARFEESLRQTDLELARSVTEWCEHGYLHTTSENTLEAMWWGAMMDMKNEYPTLRNPLHLSDKQVAELVGKIKEGLVKPYDHLKERLKRIDRNVLTKWDKDIYRATSTGLLDEMPVDSVSVQIVHKQFLRFWSDLKSFLTKPEFNQLLDWYQRQNAHFLKTHPHLCRLPS